MQIIINKPIVSMLSSTAIEEFSKDKIAFRIKPTNLYEKNEISPHLFLLNIPIMDAIPQKDKAIINAITIGLKNKKLLHVLVICANPPKIPIIINVFGSQCISG